MPKPPVQLCRLGSTNQVTVPVIGSAGTEGASVTYTTGYFGNGMNSNGNNKHVTFPNTADQYTGSAGAYEMWIKPVGWSITNGQASAGNHFLYQIVGDANNFVEFDITTSGLLLRYYTSGTFYGFGASQITPASFDLADGVWGHVAVVWNTAGINGGSNTIEFCFNGSVAASTTNALSIASGMATFYLGVYGLSPGLLYWDGVIDNFKIYDYDKTDFSDRGNERGGLNDQVTNG